LSLIGPAVEKVLSPSTFWVRNVLHVGTSDVLRCLPDHTRWHSISLKRFCRPKRHAWL